MLKDTDMTMNKVFSKNNNHQKTAVYFHSPFVLHSLMFSVNSSGNDQLGQ